MIKGSIVPLITPMRPDYSLDAASFRRHFRHVAERSDGVFVLGLTGEAHTIPQHKRLRTLDIALQEAEESPAHVLLGITGKNVAETLDMARFVQGSDVSGVVLQPSRLEYRPFARLCSAVKSMADMDLYLYINPKTAQFQEPTPEEVAELARQGLIAGAKLSVPKDMFYTYAAEVRGKVPLYIGNAYDLFDRYVVTCATGVVTGPGNLHPSNWSMAWLEVSDGNPDSNRRLILEQFRAIYTAMPSGKNAVGAMKFYLTLQERIDYDTCTSPLAQEDREYLLEQAPSLGIRQSD